MNKRRAVALFSALGDPVRLGLVYRLRLHGPLSITRLSEGTGVTRQAVTKHLNVLEAVGVVRSEWKGSERLWSLGTLALSDAREHLRWIIERED